MIFMCVLKPQNWKYGKFCSINTCRIVIKPEGRLGGKGHQYRSLALRIYTWRVQPSSHIPVVQYFPYLTFGGW